MFSVFVVKTQKRTGVVAMSTMSSLLLVGVLAAAAATSGYNGADDDGSSPDYFRGHDVGGGPSSKQLPVILMHKQALQQDGGFQYAFAADNGLRQGESIRPDGSRTGAYSYTDPNGKEITVKYTAGKDGFRIVQGDHVPKAPVSVVPLQQSPAAAHGAYAVPSSASSGRGGAFPKNRYALHFSVIIISNRVHFMSEGCRCRECMFFIVISASESNASSFDCRYK